MIHTIDELPTIGFIIIDIEIKLVHQCNKVDGLGMSCWNHALAVNTSLTFLGICQDSLDEYGMAQLGEVLKVNSTLSKLWVNPSSITDSAAGNLSAALMIYL